jgi:hypothetical protein
MGLEHILNARSVAVIGASKVPTKRGYQTIRTLLDERYEGAIYPVNPKEKSIMGLTCYGPLRIFRGRCGCGPGRHTGPDRAGHSGGLRQKRGEGRHHPGDGFRRDRRRSGKVLENQVLEVPAEIRSA